MSNHIHTKEDLLIWLLSYSEYEKICMEYYKSHNSFLPHFVKEEKLKKLNYDILDSMRPSIGVHTSYQGKDSGFIFHEERIYEEKNFINKEDAFSIIKHPRYHNCSIHSHSFFEFAFVFNGSCQQIIFSDDNVELILQKNDLILIPPFVQHRLIVDDDSIVLNILIRFEWMRRHIIPCLPQDHQFTTMLSQMIINFHFTQSHLNSTFQKTMNISLHQYLLSVKLDKACELLSTTNLPIHEIAVLVGYSDAPGFNRAFKAEKQLTPNQYRKQFMSV